MVCVPYHMMYFHMQSYPVSCLNCKKLKHSILVSADNSVVCSVYT